MRRLRSCSRFFIVAFSVVLAVVPPVWSADFGTLAEELRKLATAPQLGRMRVGVQVVVLGPEQQTVWEQNADELFKPASNQKIITTGAALSLLPKDFKYRTILARQGEDLVIIGAGDPSIGDPKLARAAGQPITAVFREWAEAVKSRGVSGISGNLVFDDSIFDQQFIPESWPGQHNLESWYTAPVGGLNFNDNCVDVVIKPSPTIGEPAIINLVPDTPWVRLENKSRTASKDQPVVHRKGSGPITISVSGRVSRANDPENPLSIPVTDPGMFFASTCRTVLASRGIHISGENRRGRVRQADGRLPGELQVLATHESAPIDFMWRVNKCSQNAFAEALFKSVSAYAGPPGTPHVGSYAASGKLVLDYLNQIGAATDGCVLDDGCGLSHMNRVTPAVLVAVLRFMDRHPLRKQWWSSLAVPGEQIGTLRRRMKGLQGKVFAKTGYISGTSTLSGYVIGPEKRFYAFSVLCNDTHRAKGGVSAAHRLQDDICKLLAAWEPGASR